MRRVIMACCLVLAAGCAAPVQLPEPAPPPPPLAISLTMYEAPLGARRSDAYPSYPGMARSLDSGAAWFSTGWVTSTSNDLAVSGSTPSLQYLAIDWGLLRSTDAGATWTLVTDRTAGSVLTVLCSGDSVWIGSVTGVYISASRGERWTAASAGLPPLNGTYVSTLLGIDSTEMLAGTAAGLFRSTDRGIRWSAAGLSGRSIERLTASGDRRRIAAVTSDGMAFLSIDRGRTWDDLTPRIGDTGVQAIAFNPLHSNELLAGTQRVGALRSTDGGATWTNVSGGLMNLHVTALGYHPHNPMLVYAGTENGAFISTNGGSQWQHSAVRLGYVSGVHFHAAPSEGGR